MKTFRNIKPLSLAAIGVITITLILLLSVGKLTSNKETVVATTVDTTVLLTTENNIEPETYAEIESDVEIEHNMENDTSTLHKNPLYDGLKENLNSQMEGVLDTGFEFFAGLGNEFGHMSQEEQMEFINSVVERTLSKSYSKSVSVIEHNTECATTPLCTERNFINSDVVFCFPSTQELKKNAFNEIKTYSEMEKFIKDNSDLYHHDKDKGEINVQKIVYQSPNKIVSKNTSDAMYRVFTISDTMLSPYNQVEVDCIRYDKQTREVYIILKETETTYAEAGISKESAEKFQQGSKSGHCIVSIEINFNAFEKISNIKIVLPEK